MNNLIKQNNNELIIWDDNQKLGEIRKLFAPKLTDLEFQAFVGMGKATGLNPFTREIWSVKYQDSAPAQIFIGRDGYRKSAQANPDYDYHQGDAVYDNDEFEVVDGQIKHRYTLKNRGNLVGAYCTVKRKKASRASYVFVELGEYNTHRSVWKDKPATMIKKVAEAQALRAAFQEQFAGTYSEDEFADTRTQTNKLKDSLNTKTIDVDYGTGEIIQQANPALVDGAADDAPASDEQIAEISRLLQSKNISDERKQNAFDYFRIEKLADLSEKSANDFILMLEKV